MSFEIQAGTPQSAINRYTVIVRAGVTYIEGAAPMSHVSALMKTADSEAFLSVRLAKLAHATAAWGSREDLDAEESRMVSEAQRTHANDPPIKQWLAYGERGRSSDAMAHKLWAERPPGWIVATDPTAHPHDPDDLRRCLLLLETVHEVRPRFPTMAEVSPVWAALVNHWPAIVDLFCEEAGPDWRTEPKEAPCTYGLMKTVIKGASE